MQQESKSTTAESDKKKVDVVIVYKDGTESTITRSTNESLIFDALMDSVNPNSAEFLSDDLSEHLLAAIRNPEFDELAIASKANIESMSEHLLATIRNPEFDELASSIASMANIESVSERWMNALTPVFDELAIASKANIESMSEHLLAAIRNPEFDELASSITSSYAWIASQHLSEKMIADTNEKFTFKSGSIPKYETDYFSLEPIPYYPSHQERLADALEENNRLQHEILKELKAQNLSTSNTATFYQSVNVGDLTPSTKSKRGRSQYSDNDKLEAVKYWDSLDPNKSSMTLPEYLEAKFGLEAGYLIVAESTFHSWRKLLKTKGLY